MDRETCSRRDAIARIAFAVLVVLACAGLVSAAALVPAPPLVLPLIAIVSIGGPMTVTPELQAGDRRAATSARRHRSAAAQSRRAAGDRAPARARLKATHSAGVVPGHPLRGERHPWHDD